jgi:hypothetical protein
LRALLERAAGLALALTVVWSATPAQATVGVGVDVGRIDVRQSLIPGGSYVLPVIGVRNPGTEPSTYRMGASAIEGEGFVPPGWFRFSPVDFALEPGRTKAVEVRMVLPTGAKPGRYQALVGATIVTHGEGTQVGAAAAARVSFTVAPASLLSAWWLKLVTFLGHAMPWSAVVPGLLFGALAIGRLRRRYAISVVKRT